MKCKKCGCEEFETKEKGIHTGVYCKSCGSWQKWVGKGATVEEVVTKPEPSKQNCGFCREGTVDVVVPTSYGDEGINGWINIDAVYCPVCGRKIGGKN